MIASAIFRYAALTCCVVVTQTIGGEVNFSNPHSRPFTVDLLNVVSRPVTVSHLTVLSRPFTVSAYSVFSRPITVFTCEDGACCMENGLFCSMTTDDECTKLGGSYQGLCSKCPPQNVVLVPEGNDIVFTHVIGPISLCGGDSRSSVVKLQPGVAFIDPWVSPADVEMCQNFGVDGSPEIPAGFFDLGLDVDSDPFTEPICLEGTPLGPTPFGQFGSADTLVRRTEDPFGLCDLPSSTERTVAAEVVALSLVGTEPITVTFNGGQNPQQWDVAVDLSSVAAPAGSVTATKSHCNGGTYTSVLNVQVLFTFTKIGEPSEVRELDTGDVGIPPVTLAQTNPMPWVSRTAPGLNLIGDPNSAFHPGIEEIVTTTACDCNKTLIHDLCDIDAGTSRDCNANNVPDECEISGGVINDCDGDGEPDACEIADCVDDPSCFDCNLNGIPDGCDIASGSSPDNNANGLPDQCEGACCLPDGICSDAETRESCVSQNGLFRGLFCGCGIVSCDIMVTGACCLQDLNCVENLAFTDCAGLNGVYQGDGSLCVNVGTCQGQDTDADGVLDQNDVCNNTPAGIAVDVEGRPVGDLDLDCDVDLIDFAALLDTENFDLSVYAVFQNNFTGQLDDP